MPTFLELAGNDVSSPRHRVLAALRDAGPLSRADLARSTGLAPSTITALSRALGDEGVLVETELTPETRRSGPRPRGLTFSSGLGHVLGIDFGFRTVRVLLADVAAQRRGATEEALPDFYSAAEGLAAASKAVRRLLAEQEIGVGAVLNAGVALPGPVDSIEQRVADSAVLPGWSGLTAGAISARLGVPVVIENDANLAALGEHVFGAGRGCPNCMTVKFHSGIGAGIIVHDRLVAGRGGAGEIGHITVDPRGPLCRCGKRGCLDTYAAVAAILDAMRAVHPDIDLRRFMSLLAEDDPGAQRVAQDAAELVGRAVATANLLIAPERIVVVGALARAGDVVTDAIAQALVRQALPHSRPPDVVQGELGNLHTALGATVLALDGIGWMPDRASARH